MSLFISFWFIIFVAKKERVHVLKFSKLELNIYKSYNPMKMTLGTVETYYSKAPFYRPTKDVSTNTKL